MGLCVCVCVCVCPGLSPGSPPSHGYKAGMSVDGIIDQVRVSTVCVITLFVLQSA